MLKKVDVRDEGNTRTITTFGLGLDIEQKYYAEIFKAWGEGWKLPSEVTRHNGSYRIFKGAISGRCILVKDEGKSVEKPKEEVKVEEPVVKTKPKPEAKPTKKTGKNK